MKFRILILIIISLVSACKTNTSALNAKENNLVSDSVRQMTVNPVNDLAVHGPVAWPNYFEESPDFFMASDGQLPFENYQSGKSFVENTLVKNLIKINLQLDHIRIDPLTTDLASIGAGFHEDLTDSAGKIMSINGYLTALAKKTNQGWKFRNLHWSILKSK